MNNALKKQFTYGLLVKIILFISLFVIGLPLDGQLGQFSAGSMYDGSIGTQIQVVENTPKINTGLLWGFIYFIAFIVFIRKSKNLHALVTSIPLFILFYTYLFITVFWSSSPMSGFIELIQLVASIVVSFTVIVYFKNSPFSLITNIAYAFGLAQLLSFILVIVAPDLSIPPNGRWCGMYGAPNSLGVLAFCSLWSNVAVVYLIKPMRTRLHIIFSIVSLINLIGTNSVTSLICSIIAIGGVFIWPHIIGKDTKVTLNRLLLILFSLSLVVFYSLGYLDSFFYDGISLAGRSSNLSGRSNVWAEALFAIYNQPLLGHGYGSQLQLVSITRLSDLHSFYITTLYSSGIVGLVLFCISQIQIIRSAFRLNIINAKLTRILVPMYIAVLVYNFSETALYGPRSPIFFILIMIMLLIQLTIKNKGKTFDRY